MFLDVTLKRNPQLIEFAIALHRSGKIPPNCFVIDRDAVAANAASIQQAARQHGLGLFFTTKQIGFNPLLARSIVEAGIEQAFAVDDREAAALARAGIRIGHLGHLGQIPTALIPAALRLNPQVVTVYSVEKARQISVAAAGLGKQVSLLLRVVADGDFLYPGQEGGIELTGLRAAAEAIEMLPGVRIAGVTSFPCLTLGESGTMMEPTSNFRTILQASHVLREELGIAVEHINAPGNTCVATIPLLAQMGATQVEPGHALTGTTYLHTQMEQAEIPAMVYVSEVSHLYKGRGYFFGGGIYRRARLNRLLVGTNVDHMARGEVVPLTPEAIDYYNAFDLPEGAKVAVGDSVLIASRAQVFVGRGYVAVVSGLRRGAPSLSGLFDAGGKAVERVL